MPAPKFLSFLPKPLLFGLYGGAGGLLGALLFGELLWYLLRPPPPAPAESIAQVALATSKDVEVFVEGRNTFPVQIARDGFTGPVVVRLEGLPTGVNAEPITIPEGKAEGEIALIAARGAAPVPKQEMKAVAEATHGGKKVTAESPINIKVTDAPRPLADVVFVLGVAPSMQWALDELKNGIGKFAESLDKARINYRLGLVTFQNFNGAGPKVVTIPFKGGPFTADSELFRTEVGKLRVAIGSGGGTIPQSSLEGVSAAAQLEFRRDATKLLLLITDSPPSVIPEGRRAEAVRDNASFVKNENIDALHVIGMKYDESVYKPLTTAGIDKSGGKYFKLDDVVRGDEGFDDLLANFGSAVTAAAIAKNPDSKPQVAAQTGEAKLGVRSLQSGEQSAAGTEGKVVLRSGAWTGAIAALVCFALLAGQHHYLRGSLPSGGGSAAGLLGGLVVGLIGGAAGQGLFFLAPNNLILGHIFRVSGWALLGGLAGAGLSLFIPNMKLVLGLIGGALGGTAGAIGFIAVSSVLSSKLEIVGRLVGGLVLGFGIGLMVAVAEAAFRRAWLEVRYGERETIAVTLGPEPVKVGSDAKACTVWARGAPPIALRFFVRDGQVICSDVIQKREETVASGFAKEVGNLKLTVRTGSGTPSAPPAAPSRPAPRPTPTAKKPAAMDLDDDDDLNLPMPLVPSVPAPKLPPPLPPKPVTANPPKPPVPAKPPAPAKPPVPARPPVPTAKSPPPAPAPVPSVAPAIKPAAKNPDTCPSCSRVIPGRPGARYCMICDQTF